jgi:cobalt-zinc-cadmium efflux system outer membrane protein
MNRLAVAAVAAILWFSSPGSARARPLTLDEALALARERAPALAAARARIDEARGRLVGASVLLRENPVLAGAAGRRSDGNGYVAGEAGLSQSFELGGRRGARIAGARAGVAREVAASEDAERRLLRDVAFAFLRALAARERLQVASDNVRLAADLLGVAERRLRAGDVARLEVNLASIAAARARAGLATADADLVAAVAELHGLLGLPPEAVVEPQGELRDRRRYDLPALLARAPERADLRALAAEVRDADAEVRLGRASAWPDLGLGFRYQRDQGADIVLGALTLTLPLFERGQGVRATATARAQRLRLELAAGQRLLQVEVRAAFDVYRRKVAAVLELERAALAPLADNDALVRRGYEAGQIPLVELLVIRREALDTRSAYVDRLLEAALAGVELEARAGVLR